MAKKQKYYVVWKGVNPGVYDNWADCQLQIKGFPGAMYKSFKNKEEAQNAFLSGEGSLSTVKKVQKKTKEIFFKEIAKNSISVDAACSGNPGIMEYRGVDTHLGIEIFRKGPFQNGTNNIGEFLAIVHALALSLKNNEKSKVIYTDSRTAISWVKKKKANTKLVKNDKNKILFELIKRAENWLKIHEITNPILKWDTENWGEIPADFGRK